MASPITHELERPNPARQSLGVLLLMAICGWLTACGGDVTPSGGGGLSVGGSGGGGGAAVCVTGGTATVLNWTAVTGAAGYRVYYGTASRQYGPAVDVGNMTNYQVPGLGSTTYYFAVTAYDGNGESSFSTEVCKTIS
jgi:hypothetical protein